MTTLRDWLAETEAKGYALALTGYGERTATVAQVRAGIARADLDAPLVEVTRLEELYRASGYVGELVRIASRDATWVRLEPLRPGAVTPGNVQTR